MNTTKKILPSDFEEILKTKLPEVFVERCANEPFDYFSISNEERDNYLLDITRTLFKENIAVAGEHRFNDWENGWSENLKLLDIQDVANALVPKYYGKHQYSRWKQQIIKPVNSEFDYRILAFLVDWAIYTYARNAKYIFEFGCGPACHLLRARSINHDAKLIGLDWTAASQKILQQIALSGFEDNVDGINFDFRLPDESVEIPKGSCVYTVAALEQINDNFEPFLQFLLKRKPAICFHFEPIDELLDENSLIDSLSLFYFRKRNYLKGYLTRLRELEKEGMIEIIRQQRTYTGSYFIEGHSLIVWRPL